MNYVECPLCKREGRNWSAYTKCRYVGVTPVQQKCDPLCTHDHGTREGSCHVNFVCGRGHKWYIEYLGSGSMTSIHYCETRQ